MKVAAFKNDCLTEKQYRSRLLGHPKKLQTIKSDAEGIEILNVAKDKDVSGKTRRT